MYNNCCDYTNDVLSKAELDGKYVQKYIQKVTNDENTISIPVVDVKAIKKRGTIDYFVQGVKEAIDKISDMQIYWN